MKQNPLLKNIWVINLNSSQDRWKKISRHFDSLGLDYHRFGATYGASLSKQEKERYTTFLSRNFSCTDSMIGCGLSHLKLWEHLYKNFPKENWFLIVEDDVELASLALFGKLLKLLEKEKDVINKPYYINLSHLYYSVHPKTEALHIIENRFLNFTTQIQLVNRKALETLLKKIKKITYHIDNEIGENIRVHSTNISFAKKDSLNMEHSINMRRVYCLPLLYSFLKLTKGQKFMWVAQTSANRYMSLADVLVLGVLLINLFILNFFYVYVYVGMELFARIILEIRHRRRFTLKGAVSK